MNPLFRIDFSISDSLKIVRKSVLIYETIIGKEKMVLTPEQEQVLYEYECNLLTQKEAREKIGVSHTTFYRFLNEYRSRNVDCKGILEAYMINRRIQ